MAANQNEKKSNIFLKMHPVQRIITGIVFALIVYFLFPKDASKLILATCMWIAFAITYLTISWIVMFTRSVPDIKKVAAKDDGSKAIVFLLIIISSFASMLAVLFIITSKDSKVSDSSLFIPVAIAGMILSWGMVHTLFAFHYAHDFYGNDGKNLNKINGGLEFPGDDKNLDYIDFAYFAFVIGCTFQVSDVEISSKKIRRLAFVHQLIAFALNTFVVALTINLIAGLNN